MARAPSGPFEGDFAEDSTTPGGTTEDSLLGGGVRLRQPAGGYRAAIDPVFLAAAVPAGTGQSVLDVGAGVGAASLCLARRVPDCSITGLELQDTLVKLATQNIFANDVGDRVEVIAGDLLAQQAGLYAGHFDPASFDHVMANPPYLKEGSGKPPPDESKAAALMETSAGVESWVQFCLTLVKPKGSLTMIHRADRIEDLLSALRGEAGEIVVFPLWPKLGKAARRVVVRCRRGIKTPTRLAAGLVLHNPDGSYTPEADEILRNGRELEI